ncbi:hypothetical protein ACFQ6C_26630 [Streptomyces sp. NPDC056454]|uniref:hypothetical protein n=1 Tax=Streptomyces sp. NPDC056454 TaxID=3345823 RepID=UPI0036A40AD0
MARRMTVEGRRVIGGPGAPVHFGRQDRGLYVSDVLDDGSVYRLERLARNDADDRFEAGWYLSGGDHHREWCAADLLPAVTTANTLITGNHF